MSRIDNVRNFARIYEQSNHDQGAFRDLPELIASLNENELTIVVSNVSNHVNWQILLSTFILFVDPERTRTGGLLYFHSSIFILL